MVETLHTENILEMMVSKGPAKLISGMTREQFHRFLLGNPDYKIERDKYGHITIHPPMTLDSGFSEGEAFFALKLWSKSNKLGKTYSPSTAFDLPDGSTCKADGAWISMEKLNTLTEQERKHIAAIVPDFVLDVRSQTDSISQLKRKMEAWIANGVRLAWLIDPIKEKVWVYRPDGSKEEVIGFSGKLAGENVLPGFEFDLKEMKADR